MQITYQLLALLIENEANVNLNDGVSYLIMLTCLTASSNQQNFCDRKIIFVATFIFFNNSV